MAKHAVPKKKASHSRTHRRYRAFATKKHKSLNKFVQIIMCKACGNPKLNQCACKSCGDYRGRSTVDKAKTIEKITKIKA